MGKWSKKPKKGCCEYVIDGTYCVEPVSNKYRDKEYNKYCIFHSRNYQKRDEFYEKIRIELKKNNNTVEKQIEALQTENLPEEILKERENQVRHDNQLIFRGYYFPDVAVFSSATFNGEADFSDATFGGVAVFSSATFNGEADFNRAAFSGNVYFDRADFSGDANFIVPAFSGEVSFSYATFSGKAKFLWAAFSGETDFRETIFSGEADFRSAAFFRGDADFRDATFVGVTNFGAINSNNHLNFDNAKFTKRTYFTGVDLTKASFNGAELHNSLLQGIKYSNRTLKGILLDTFTENTNRIFARDAADHNYILQRLAEIKKPWRTEIRWQKLLFFVDLFKRFINTPFHLTRFFLWNISSNYGRSFILWLFWCLIIAVFFGFVYSSFPPGYLKYSAYTDTQSTITSIDPFYYSIVTFTTLGFGDIIPLHNTAMKWVTAEYTDKKSTIPSIAPFYYSIVTFTTLGFGDIIPKNSTAMKWVIAEVILGYLMLGGLVSIMANIFARRA